MPLTLYNTLTRKLEEFTPVTPGTVTMYVCGVTPYDSVHLGHARAYTVFDTVRRFLEHSGYKVTYIQNFTDVDDKIIKRAQEVGIHPVDLANRYIEDYFIQTDKLNIKRATGYPRVTENIPQITAFIKTLIEKGHAYVLNGDVYYSVRSFPGYGKLSKRSLDELKSGARVEVDEEKRDPLDFALWKKTKPGEPEGVSWDSPWGKGRPGWHIECSVMSTDALGATIDIHGGGLDLVFPHHENEIAQSEGATGKPFVRYWIHNGFVTINMEKMSKSLGNFFSLSDIFKKFPPRVVRYFLLSRHYRSPLDFADDKLKEAGAALAGIDEAYRKLAAIPANGGLPGHLPDLGTEEMPETIAKVHAALNDDFNTEKALAVLHDFKREVLSTFHDKSPQKLNRSLLTMSVILRDYLGIELPSVESVPQEALDIKKTREEARKEKKWQEADVLRKKLDSLGYKVEDNPDGTSTLIRK